MCQNLSIWNVLKKIVKKSEIPVQTASAAQSTLLPWLPKVCKGSGVVWTASVNQFSFPLSSDEINRCYWQLKLWLIVQECLWWDFYWHLGLMRPQHSWHQTVFKALLRRKTIIMFPHPQSQAWKPPKGQKKKPHRAIILKLRTNTNKNSTAGEMRDKE